jgi:hypothetical protein
MWFPITDDRGTFNLKLWGEDVWISYPGGEAFKKPGNVLLPAIEQTLLLYYFCCADESPITGNWISFSELPNGKFYTKAFQSYTGKELTRVFQDNLNLLIEAAASLGGAPGQMGDASFQIQALPKVPLLVVYWLGDEDFPSSSQILFDANANRFLPTDAYAILGSMITRKLIAANRNIGNKSSHEN